MASESTKSADSGSTSKAAGKSAGTPGVDVSPEGVAYQTSGFPKSKENPGPFPEGEGLNSPLLQRNVDAAKEAEDEAAANAALLDQ